MRIEHLSFDNINSLGGHFELDFTHPSLADAGIFVITGPTGAGKSTLLDAITYALYGQTARQGKLTASSNEIMTHGARRCRAELVVEKDGQRYLFCTEQRRKKLRVAGNDPYTTAERSASRVEADGSATLLATGRAEVDRLAAELMSYDNFRRCMMLAQGEFARFLRAEEKERSDALATITGTEIYERIGGKVHEHVAELRARLQAAALLPVKAEAQRAEAERRRDAQAALCHEQQAEWDALNRVLAWHESLARATEARRVHAAAQQQAQAALQAFADAGKPARIAAAEAAQSIRPLELSSRSAAQAVAKAQQQLEGETAWLRQHPDGALKKAAEQAATRLAQQQPALEERLRFLAETVQPLEEAVGKAEIHARSASRLAAERLRESTEAHAAVAQAEQAARQAATTAQAAAVALAALPSMQEAMQAHEAAQERAALAYKIQSVSGKLEELYREFCNGRLPCCPCCGSPEPHRHPRQDAGALAQAQQEARERAAELAQLQRATEEARNRQASATSTQAAARKAAELARAEATRKAELHQLAAQAAAQAEQALEELRANLATTWQGGPARREAEAARATLTGLQQTCAESREALHRLTLERATHAAHARSAEEQLPQLREQATQAAARFSAALREHHFADEAACAAAQLPTHTLEQLRREEAALRQAYAAAEGAHKLAAAQEEELRGQALSEETPQALVQKKVALAQLLHEQKELLTAVLAEIRQDDEARRANAKQEAALADTRRELAQWLRLHEILGGAKDGFKKYAQRITFNLLIEQANLRLRQLSDRYTLLQGNTGSLELFVLDRYQDEEQGRHCSNLSGGESFIVSLALALGLASMTGETRIDTLFLDEGFGTLDENALEQVLSCLQQLQAGGKLIGIISHVEALKERIPSTLTLLPRGSTGLSTIAPHEAVIAEPMG